MKRYITPELQKHTINASNMICATTPAVGFGSGSKAANSFDSKSRSEDEATEDDSKWDEGLW